MSRDPAMQVCPVAANTPATRPLAAARRSASGNTTWGDLPPSSRVTLLRFSAAACATARPVAVEPVMALITPGGNPAWANSSANRRVDTGECSEGLTTTGQPAARAGAIFQVNRSNGEFHGVIAATTPTGSRRV